MKKFKLNIAIVFFRRRSFVPFCTIIFLISGCESLVEVDMPSVSLMEKGTVFSDASNAELAVIGLYSQMRNSSHPFYGDSDGLSDLAGLYADELFYTGMDIARLQFQESSLQADNNMVLNVWSQFYETISSANMLIENLENAENIPLDTRNQLIGEALFIRALNFFNLVNLFGEVPLVLTSDYRVNANIPRTSLEEVYEQIEEDLLQASEMMTWGYPNEERVRATDMTAKALLSRVYLYQEKWEEAEIISSEVINNTDYGLVALESITLSNNREAILQFSPSGQSITSVTPEGLNYGGNSSVNVLQEDFAEIFEPGDERKSNWMRQNNSLLQVPYKYKVGVSGGTSRLEYTTIFRLAEQYLIRAESRAEQEKLAEAVLDIDVVRGRAGLTLISETNPGIPREDLLDAIMQERRVEFFSEWGHRWFDLKRTGNALQVLQVIKPDFNSNKLLWPIPQQEINNNPALRDHQNTGY
ncbi:RagB/SusD family nutrient uptake outer membrane protein [Sinomicrobium soli]|uniref:RagB/SusD family nutrient uptake outer membrane protein n=1 Tax=Sinomicrobium sp. N-1-3-6 TaxID=2219864 RepID=UPI000DCEA63B|nr:RagB/SusD family nutrient uptake outer membrane protein [Sinomicrobium sp. N-1-3-6]RAV29465.1 RagB/SusD family nutrient uptake outer membrane protein [Sinomicrobium sp. N-1-3-6]